MSKLFIFVGILIMILLSYFFIFPFLLVGPPEPLFFINNNDLQSHEITVEVYDSHNESIFKEKYELAPGEYIAQPKSLWLLLQWLMPWSQKGEEGEYEFKVSLDGEIEDTCRMLPYPWTSVDIDIKNNSNSPISIGVETV